MSSVLFLVCASSLWVITYLIFIISQFNINIDRLILISTLNYVYLTTVNVFYKLKLNIYFILSNYNLISLKLKFNRLFF